VRAAHHAQDGGVGGAPSLASFGHNTNRPEDDDGLGAAARAAARVAVVASALTTLATRATHLATGPYSSTFLSST
jgi:hypothetical protein